MNVLLLLLVIVLGWFLLIGAWVVVIRIAENIRIRLLTQANVRLRDQFAMSTLAGVLSYDHLTPTEAAVAAYDRADAMMELRKRRLENG